jgi:hypothetical protein
MSQVTPVITVVASKSFWQVVEQPVMRLLVRNDPLKLHDELDEQTLLRRHLPQMVVVADEVGYEGRWLELPVELRTVSVAGD